SLPLSLSPSSRPFRRASLSPEVVSSLHHLTPVSSRLCTGLEAGAVKGR
ncbi:hypothetical protein Zm00014a_039527, partial [Zea mays]